MTSSDSNRTLRFLLYDCFWAVQVKKLKLFLHFILNTKTTLSENFIDLMLKVDPNCDLFSPTPAWSLYSPTIVSVVNQNQRSLHSTLYEVARVILYRVDLAAMEMCCSDLLQEA